MEEKYIWQPRTPYCVVLFYKYCALDEVPQFQQSISTKLSEFHLLGRILISIEGINGTVSGNEIAVKDFVSYLALLHPSFASIDWKYSFGQGSHLPFFDSYVRIVDEIISTGKPKSLIAANSHFDNSYGGLAGGGQHLAPEQFHSALEEDSSAVILDIRNDVEYDIGHFKNAVGLTTLTYADTWDRIDHVIAKEQNQKKNYYLYCTGGIRCEKASVYLKAKGIENVYQLEGGIHRYLETYPTGGLFEGKNFVFDNRVAMSATEQNQTDNIVGRCLQCDAPHDKYSGRVVCTVCRVPILLCDTCVSSAPIDGEYHCKKHWNMRHMYYTVLDRFTIDELQEQMRQLCQYQNSLLGKNSKSKRRMLHKQQQRLQSRIEELRAANGSNIVQDELVNPQHRVGIKAGGIWRE